MLPRKILAFTILHLILAMWAPSAKADLVEKSRLDPMNYHYAGLEINGDDFADTIMINRITGRMTFLFGKPDGSSSRHGIYQLSQKERDGLPDTVKEADLDSDTIKDLIVVNLRLMEKAASRSDRIFMRMLEGAAYFGTDSNTFRTLRFRTLPEEDQKLIEQNAKSLLLPSGRISDLNSP